MSFLNQIFSLEGELRYFQRKAIEKLITTIDKEVLKPKICLVKLPTGYGKTLIGLSPFLYQLINDKWLSFSWLCYVLPTRVLCNSVRDKIEDRYLEKLKKGINKQFNVNIKAFHGGIESSDELFADVAITTFDTFTLSYARRTIGGSHLERPAGFIATSLLVLDEAHMLHDENLHAFSLLRAIIRSLYKVGVPIVFMSATIPKCVEEYVLNGIPERDIEYVIEKDEEFNEDPSTYRGIIEEATFKEDKDINEIFKQEGGWWKRLLVVCNTVERATELYKNFNEEGVYKILIHSRIRRDERERRERVLKLMMREAKCDECNNIKPLSYIKDDKNSSIKVLCEECGESLPNSIKVNRIAVFATQVIEAGLDISSDLLITELSPVDSLIQRSGRCARFKGEKGKVVIVDVKDPLPYPLEFIKRSREAIKEYESNLAPYLFEYKAMQNLLNDAYTDLIFTQLDNEVKQYVTYLEGTGLLTFTIDWQMIDNLRTRPGLQLTLVALKDNLKCMNAHVEHKIKGKNVVTEYSVLEEITISLKDLLSKFNKKDEEDKEEYLTVLKEDEVINSSFPLNLKDASKIPDCLKINGGYVYELMPFYVYEGKRVKVYKIQRSTQRLREGIYLVNPDYYDDEIGLWRLSH
ncbi:MAG: CRISPR-associated helicase Cas3' [Nitrososphaerales archaeon]